MGVHSAGRKNIVNGAGRASGPEAAAQPAGALPGKRLDLKIGFACNNFCDFCAQGGKRALGAGRTLAQVKAALARARRSGARAVVFTGGEPTLHPDLPAAARLARGSGYTTVQVQTNGRRLAFYDYCLELKRAGVTEVSPSLHGSTPEVHEGLTRAPGGFAEVVRGILNCRKAGFYVLTNSVVTSKNYKDLPALARLLVHLGVDQFQFAFVHMVGTAWDNRAWLTPRKTDALPYIKKALDIGLAAGVPCYTEAVPFCLMKGYEDCVAERVIPEGPVADAGFYVESYGDYRRGEGKSRREECRPCAWYGACEGPWREYPELYGWSEFKPVKKASGGGRRRRSSGKK